MFNISTLSVTLAGSENPNWVLASPTNPPWASRPQQADRLHIGLLRYAAHLCPREALCLRKNPYEPKLSMLPALVIMALPGFLSISQAPGEDQPCQRVA